MIKPNSRHIACQILLLVIQKKQSLQTTLKTKTACLSDKDQALTQAICYGVLRQYDALEAILNLFLAKPLRNKAIAIKILLLLGIYQLLYMRTPNHAAVAETVSAAKPFNIPWASGMINGVLRNVSRQKFALQQQMKTPTVELSPEWLINAIKAAYPQDWHAIIQESHREPPMHLRVNATQTNRRDYLKLLRAKGIDAMESDLSRVGITLGSPQPVSQLPHFEAGWCSVQDVAAQQAAILLDPHSGERILDACAAPGGKTTHLLEQCPHIELTSLELDTGRLAKIKENLKRLDFEANLICGDATQSDWHDGKPFDRILVDAPCSATGVIRRHPDIRFLRQAEDIPKLTATQLAILENLWPMLKKDGRLLYATCSILPIENDELIHAFCTQHSEAKILKTWQILPQQNGPDGFYYALLQKQ